MNQMYFRLYDILNNLCYLNGFFSSFSFQVRFVDSSDKVIGKVIKILKIYSYANKMLEDVH
jgi:hypothetical protein